MKTAAILLLTWATAFGLLLWLGDFNMYVVYPNGKVWMKEYARFWDRALNSLLISFAYSLVNTVLIRLCVRRFPKAESVT